MGAIMDRGILLCIISIVLAIKAAYHFTVFLFQAVIALVRSITWKK